MGVQVVEEGFSLGIRRDISRDKLPKGAAYDLLNYLIQHEGAISKRGGWKNASADLNALSSFSEWDGLAWAPFDSNLHGAGPQLLAVAQHTTANTRLYRVPPPYDGTGGVYIGTLGTDGSMGKSPPFWHKDMVIIPRGGAVHGPMKLTAASGTFTLGTLGGSPPDGSVGASYGDYVLLANGRFALVGPDSTFRPNRIWICGVGTPEAGWNNTTAVLDMPMEIMGIVPIKNLVLVFGKDEVWGLTGDTPPPAGNWNRVYLYGEGLSDVRSVARYKDYVIWANADGVFRSDGSGITDLTEQGGISEWWRELMGFWDAAIPLSAGVMRGHYFVSMGYPLQMTFVCDLDNFVWSRHNNIYARAYASAPMGSGAGDDEGEELFFGHDGHARLGRLSPIWTPSGSNDQDANGTSVVAELHTRFWNLGGGTLQSIRKAYVDYRLHSDVYAPNIDVMFETTPYDGSPVLTGNLKETGHQIKRRAVEIRRNGHGLALYLHQFTRADKLDIHSILIESHALDPTRVVR